MRDLGEINYCLGITFERDEKQIILKQRQYIETILENFGCKDCKPASTPMDTGLKLTKGTSPTKEKDIPYQNLIGSLMYLAVATRPDIMFAVSHLSQFNNCYTSEHFQAAKTVLRYLKGTKQKDLNLTYIKGNMKLEGAADADWASCAIDRRSVTGYVFTYGGTPISWEAKKQRTVALCTAEAEYLHGSNGSIKRSHIPEKLAE
ncbi:uncharacterized protein [Choristoneura fumiferana]|uniref:uncharacterized protein n=1 Tax=Choristoneura fumiferana TaxID=7141 RepID=UPI003D156741